MLFVSLALGDVDARSEQANRLAILKVEPSFQIDPAFLTICIQGAEFIFEWTTPFAQTLVERFDACPLRGMNACQESFETHAAARRARKQFIEPRRTDRMIACDVPVDRA